MASLNKILLIGNLGRDPEVKFTPSGSRVATFSMATTEKWNNKDGSPEEHTEWHNIVCWNKLAEIVEKYLSKGKQVYIEGRLRTREWTDNEGGKRRTVEVIAGQMVMLGSRSDTSAPTSYQKPTEVVDDGSITDDDIPF